MIKHMFRSHGLACQQQPLGELIHNQLEEDRIAQVVAHLDCCQDCQQRLTELSADRQWWQQAAQWLDGQLDEASSESALSEPDDHPGRAPEDALKECGLMTPSIKPGIVGEIGRYDVRGIIGTGGTGIVLQAVDSHLDRVVAVKVLAPFLASHGAARRRFSREGQAAASVAHENVVAIYHVESTGPIPFLVMQYIDGCSLQELVMRSGPIDVTSTLRMIAQLADALAAAHAQGLVHRDIKPANILVGTCGGRVWITDFGLARAVDDASLTRSGFIAGTPHYMSPEQARGESVGSKSDLFGLGSVMYFALTGRPPFRAERSLAILNRICHEQHRPVREVNSEVPQSVAAIVDRLLQKNPSDRYARAEEVRADCLHILASPVEELERSAAEPSIKRWRQPILRLGAFLLLCAGLGWLGNYAWLEGSNNLKNGQASFAVPQFHGSSGVTFDTPIPSQPVAQANGSTIPLNSPAIAMKTPATAYYSIPSASSFGTETESWWQELGSLEEEMMSISQEWVQQNKSNSAASPGDSKDTYRDLDFNWEVQELEEWIEQLESPIQPHSSTKSNGDSHQQTR